MRHWSLSSLKRRHILTVISYTLCLGLLTACGNNDFSDLDKYIKSVKTKTKTPIDPLPERKPIDPFSFNPENQRDPFRPLEQTVHDEVLNNLNSAAATNGIRPDLLRHKEELEAFSLDSLRMVGTVQMNSSLWALVSTNDKTIYRAQVGNYMGKNYGKIIRISPDKIEVMEIIPDKPGTWREKQASLALTDSVRNKK